MNGYPNRVILKTIAYKLKDFTSPTLHTVKNCPVYLHLPWLGISLVRHESEIKATTKKCFFAVKECVIFTCCLLLPAIQKDKLPALLLSNVVNKFLCHCNS